MFPVSKGTSIKHPFDPMQECVALAAHKKKKASNSRIKHVAIQVVMLSRDAPLIVPRGKRRLTLVDAKRIYTVTLKRGASPLEVRNAVMFL